MLLLTGNVVNRDCRQGVGEGCTTETAFTFFMLAVTTFVVVSFNEKAINETGVID